MQIFKSPQLCLHFPDSLLCCSISFFLSFSKNLNLGLKLCFYSLLLLINHLKSLLCNLTRRLKLLKLMLCLKDLCLILVSLTFEFLLALCEILFKIRNFIIKLAIRIGELLFIFSKDWLKAFHQKFFAKRFNHYIL